MRAAQIRGMLTKDKVVVRDLSIPNLLRQRVFAVVDNGKDAQLVEAVYYLGSILVL